MCGKAATSEERSFYTMRHLKKTIPVLVSAVLLVSAVMAHGLSAEAAKKISISHKTLSLKVGGSKKLSLKNLPKKQKVKWSSSNKQVASVSSAGKVTARKEGRAKITAIAGKKKYICRVTVKKAAAVPVPEADPADGDVYYTTPDNYRAFRNDVKYGEVQTLKYFSSTTQRERTLSVVLPPDYSKEKQYPVCYLLHGLGQDHTDWLNANAPLIIGNMIASGTAEEMILVLPNCRARANDAANPPDAFSLGNYQAFDNFINDLRDNVMPFIKENFSIKEGRENTAIAGFSMGGRTALYIGLSMQETFGHIGGFCPAPGLFAYTMNGVSEDGLFTKEAFRLSDAYADNTLLMVVAGKTDTIVGNFPETYHNALAENGTKHIWYKKAGGHDVNVMNNALYNFAMRIFRQDAPE
ncbi:hypothetical protein D7V82_09285 [bacterium 1xD8-6]|nr:hypothetical protein D7V72_10530 [bacterium D16-36]RKI69612.1 hypothetical protein D7V82_09285 [bacterium 1xD8-6]